MAVSQVRVSVLLGTYERKYKIGSTTKTIKNQVYTWVRKEVAEYFNMNVVANPKGGDGNKGAEVRGTKGAGSIKLPTGKKTSKGFTQYYAVPMPAYFKIEDMRKFVNDRVKQHKPERFIAPSGRSYPV